MIILTTKLYRKISPNTAQSEIVAIQYFEDNEKEQVRQLYNEAQKYWEERATEVSYVLVEIIQTK